MFLHCQQLVNISGCICACCASPMEASAVTRVDATCCKKVNAHSVTQVLKCVCMPHTHTRTRTHTHNIDQRVRWVNLRATKLWSRSQSCIPFSPPMACRASCSFFRCNTFFTPSSCQKPVSSYFTLVPKKKEKKKERKKDKNNKESMHNTPNQKDVPTNTEWDLVKQAKGINRLTDITHGFKGRNNRDLNRLQQLSEACKKRNADTQICTSFANRQAAQTGSRLLTAI